MIGGTFILDYILINVNKKHRFFSKLKTARDCGSSSFIGKLDKLNACYNIVANFDVT